MEVTVVVVLCGWTLNGVLTGAATCLWNRSVQVFLFTAGRLFRIITVLASPYRRSIVPEMFSSKIIKTH